MGNSESRATAYTYLSSSINADVSASCSGSAVIDSRNIAINIGTIDCPEGDVNIGNNTINQEINCNNDTTIQAFSQAVINSSASADASMAFLNSDTADSNDAVTVMHNISSNVQSRCDTSSVIRNRDETFTVGTIKGKNCNVGNNTIDQKFACVNQIIENLTTKDDITQSASATSGTNFAQLIGIAIIVAVLGVVVALITRRKKGAPALDTIGDLEREIKKTRTRIEVAQGELEGYKRGTLEGISFRRGLGAAGAAAPTGALAGGCDDGGCVIA